MKRSKSTAVGQAAGRHRTLWASACVVAASLAGCGGGGGDSGPPAGGGASSATGTLRVKVVDVFGDPVAGAAVAWYPRGSQASPGSSWTLQTDSQGDAELRPSAGEGIACAYHPVRGESTCDPQAKGLEVAPGQAVEVVRQLQPHDRPAAAVLSTTVEPGGVSADGTTLDVTLRVAVSGPLLDGSWFVEGEDWGDGRLSVASCLARTGDDLAELGPRCIRGPDGSDTSYSDGKVNELGGVRSVEGSAVPRAVGLLIDQSEAGRSAAWLPNDPRLFAAKLLADSLLPEPPVLLGAFASDESSGSASGLPRRPLTLFPAESPAFLNDRVDVFNVLDGLRDVVGGGTPLYQAMTQAIEDLAIRTPPGAKPALVVLADGDDTTCGTPVQCAALRKEIVQRAHDAAVDVFLVVEGHEPEGCIPGWCTGTNWAKTPVTVLAREGSFPIVVAPDGAALGSPVELFRQWISGPVMVQDISLRLTSDTAGAFAPGAVVMGYLEGSNASQCSMPCEQCSMSCERHQLIFGVEIPR